MEPSSTPGQRVPAPEREHAEPLIAQHAGTLRARLRQDTAADHEAVDAAVNLQAALATRAGYREFLLRMGRAAIPLESLIAIRLARPVSNASPNPMTPDATVPPLVDGEMTRAARLIADLTVLGEDDVESAEPRSGQDRVSSPSTHSSSQDLLSESDRWRDVLIEEVLRTSALTPRPQHDDPCSAPAPSADDGRGLEGWALRLTDGHWAGMVYVLEGSAMGAQMIAKLVHQAHGYTADRGAAYLGAGAKSSSVRFRQWLDWIESVAGSTETSREQAVWAARRTFAYFHRSMIDPLAITDGQGTDVEASIPVERGL